jgi:hypothetical protein
MMTWAGLLFISAPYVCVYVCVALYYIMIGLNILFGSASKSRHIINLARKS